jgi:hypothetical protein
MELQPVLVGQPGWNSEPAQIFKLIVRPPRRRYLRGGELREAARKCYCDQRLQFARERLFFPWEAHLDALE